MRSAPRSSRGRLSGLVLLGALLAGCATVETPAPAAPAPPAVSVSQVAPAPPVWRPGDRWVYAWSAGGQSGIKTAEVVERRVVNEVPYYVVRVGDLDHFYTADLHWAGSAREGKVESRMVPALPWFMWPLEVGRRWSHEGSFESLARAVGQSDQFAVVSAETVEVPAGRFAALKLVREGSGRDSDEYWYAPEVGFYVKWVGRRGETQFEEVLREHRASPRLIPGTAPPAPPSGTR